MKKMIYIVFVCYPGYMIKCYHRIFEQIGWATDGVAKKKMLDEKKYVLNAKSSKPKELHLLSRSGINWVPR